MLQMVYFACFVFINCSIIFWGSYSSMRNVSIIKKRNEIGIMLRLGPMSSCRKDFKELDVLKVPCLYI